MSTYVVVQESGIFPKCGPSDSSRPYALRYSHAEHCRHSTGLRLNECHQHSAGSADNATSVSEPSSGRDPKKADPLLRIAALGSRNVRADSRGCQVVTGIDPCTNPFTAGRPLGRLTQSGPQVLPSLPESPHWHGIGTPMGLFADFRVLA